MLTVYSLNNGTRFAIRLTGPRFTWTVKIYNIATKAQSLTFKTEKEAQEWIDSQM